MDLKTQFDYYINLINDFLTARFSKDEGNEKLLSAMKYSTFAGGKRIRPALMLAFSEAFGLDLHKVVPFAAALELIHASSLVHDDLPALDNDDLRRGRPSNHKVFGEAFAVIAGDALMNLAYEICFENCKTESEIKACRYLANSAGYAGMLGGQAYDIENEFAEPDEKTLLLIDNLKTAKLLSAPVVMAAVLADKDEQKASVLGEKLGLLFQFTDDLLDVTGDEKLGKTLGKDEKEGKLTAVTVYGIATLKEKIDALKSECVKIARELTDNEFVEFLIAAIAERKK